MLLRHVIEHVKAQNWTAVFLDFIIVVMGVLLAFQISAWNEDRQDAVRTQSYYRHLIDDLLSERQALRVRLQYMSVAEKYARYTMAALDDPEAMQKSEFLIAAYQASQVWAYAPQRATYDEILSSGVAEAIPDPDLRALLANFYRNAEAVNQIIASESPYREHIRSYLPYDIQAAIRKSCGDVYLPGGNGLLTPRLPDSCAVEFRGSEIENAIAGLKKYEMFKEELTLRLASVDVKRNVIEHTIELIDSLIANLAARVRPNQRDRKSEAAS